MQRIGIVFKESRPMTLHQEKVAAEQLQFLISFLMPWPAKKSARTVEDHSISTGPKVKSRWDLRLDPFKCFVACGLMLT